MKTIYFDNNATTQPCREAAETHASVMRSAYGNPSSVHVAGQEAKHILEEAREKIAALLGAAKPSEIIFTASGTEAINTAVKGVAFAATPAGRHIITTAVEHHAVLSSCEYLEKHHGFEITVLPVDSFGMVSPGSVQNALRDDTALVAVMHANNEIGTIQPVGGIGRILRRVNETRKGAGRRKIYFLVDAVQTAGKLDVNAAEIGADFLAVSAHKFYGPKGVGCLYAKEDAAFHPLLHGGHHEGNRRASTENVAGAASMAAALALACSHRDEENTRLLRLREKLEKGIMENVADVRLNGHPSERLAGTLNLAFGHIEGESLVVALDMAGVAASTGSACASGSTDPSHVISATGCSPDLARGAVRFSLGKYNTESEVARLLEILPGLVEKLRKISPTYKSK